MHVIDVEQFIFDSETVPPFFQVLQQCHSVHHELGDILMFGYSILLTLLMVLLTILTRKIKCNHYKDSKKINLLVTILILTVYTFAPLHVVYIPRHI